MKSIVLSLFLFVLALFSGAAAQAQTAPPAVDGGARVSSGYRIGPKDLLKIQVYELPELNVEARVAEDGTINLPYVGDIPAVGLTAEELAGRLKVLLESKYVQRASTAVEVREFRSKPIAVIGAVKLPGNLAFSGRWTLLEAITAAGGLAENHGNVVHVLRRADNGLSDQVTIDLADLLVRADPRVNLPILSNDLINVPTTVSLTIYCLGEVGKPGALEFKSTERITLLAAIARAGGLTDRASSKILIKRSTTGSQGGRGDELTVDYKRIVGGREADVELREGDVVVVKESFF